MVRKIGAALLCAGALASAAAEESDVRYKPLSIAGFSEAGRFYNPRYGAKKPIENDWFDHFGVFLTQSADVGDNMAFDIGLGGIFQYMKSEEIQSRWLGTQWKMFFIGPTVADIRYGSLREGEGFGLQFGRFTYKYNPEATNLGEYLFRSAAFPTLLMGGGYAFQGDPRAYLQGVRGHWNMGSLKVDAILNTETTLPALYDFSLAGLVNYKVAEGLFEVGAGVNFKRLIPVRPSKTTPEVYQNAYFDRGGTTYVGFSDYYSSQQSFWESQAKRHAADPVVAAQDSTRAVQFKALAFQVSSLNKDSLDLPSGKVGGWRDTSNGLVPGSSFFTQRSIMAMVRLATDLKPLFGSDLFGADDLKASLEVNFLGIGQMDGAVPKAGKYPVFYEKLTERMPITASFNLPAFKVLDLLSFQIEYFNSPWMNGYANLLGSGSRNLPLPTIPTGTDSLWNQAAFNDVSARDNVSWSLLAKKNFAGAAYITGQIARDHSRMVSKDFWTGGGLEPTEVLNEKTTWKNGLPDENWYFVVQLGFGI